jgi:pyruvate dehydrogenase E2 component (dihydrolipoamide acetyltransferase)
MRRAIARRLVQSKATAPHIYLRLRASVSDLLEARQAFNLERNIAVTLNDVFIRAAALALAQVPDVNVQYTDEATLRFDSVDIAFAVSVPGGLVTPVIRAAHRKTLPEISGEARMLSMLAREGRLMPGQVEGGTFTVSNLGMLGIEDFSAVINPPQAAILAVGAVVGTMTMREKAPVLVPMISLNLSCDHRAIDGAVGAQYLASLKNLLETPAVLFS